MQCIALPCIFIAQANRSKGIAMKCTIIQITHTQRCTVGWGISCPYPCSHPPINPSPLRTQLVNRKYLKLFRLNASHRIQANDADSVGKKKSQKREMRLQKIWFRSFIKNKIRQVQVEWKNICIYIFLDPHTRTLGRVSLTTYDLFLTRLLQHHNENPHPSRRLAKQSEWQNASQKNKPFKIRLFLFVFWPMWAVAACRLYFRHFLGPIWCQTADLNSQPQSERETIRARTDRERVSSGRGWEVARRQATSGEAKNFGEHEKPARKSLRATIAAQCPRIEKVILKFKVHWWHSVFKS